MEFVIGGLAATAAGILTNPLEVVKHQMEISKKSQFTNKYQTFFHTGFKVARNEGLRSLQKGLSPALGAHLISYGMKLGTYQFGVSNGLTRDANGQTLVLNSISTSAVGGLLGQYMSSPFYLLKAVHHAEDGDKKKGTYSDTAKKIFREHGLRGFFRGATASLPRAIIGTSQLTSFAVTKETLSNYEVFVKHPFCASTLAGVVAGIVLSMTMTPFETVINSMYKQAINPSKTKNSYAGFTDCISQIYKKDGFKPFYRGIGPIYLKLGPHTALCLVFWEELKSAYDQYQNQENTMQPKSRAVSKLDLYNSLIGSEVTLQFDYADDQYEKYANMAYL